MKQIVAIGRQTFGLFVEDARLTAALAIWIAIVAATRTWWQSAPRLGAIALFAGFAVILCENVRHAARRD
jgi:hypothetical protein